MVRARRTALTIPQVPCDLADATEDLVALAKERDHYRRASLRARRQAAKARRRGEGMDAAEFRREAETYRLIADRLNEHLRSLCF